LVAEISAAFLCAEAGIATAVLSNQAAYLSGWLKALRDDRRLVVDAAAHAQRATDYILGRSVKNP
jgi:antirestriction protein ArdC